MAGEIFISYRRADIAWAKLLHDHLKAEGVEAWYDAQVGAGQDWRLATANALEASRIFVLLFTANAALSKDIAKELAAATLENKLIIPVRLENIQPKGAFLYELASRNWINAFEDTEAKLEELAKGLAQLVRTGTNDDSVLPLERKTGAKAPPLPHTRKTIPALIAGAALVMAAVAGGLFWQHARPVAPQTQPTASRVAVLPFEMLSGNGDARTFADTISEPIVATLNDAQVQTISREDAKTLSGTDRDAAAAKLGVEFIVNGSVESGDQGLHVTVHLDHVLTHATVWTASYDQKGPRWRRDSNQTSRPQPPVASKPRSTQGGRIPRKWMTRPWASFSKGAKSPGPRPRQASWRHATTTAQSLHARPNTPGAI